MIFIAEDNDFSIEQSKILSPWLLNFAKKYRDGVDNNHDKNRYAIWSAIRTGASMLTPDKVNNLISLLEIDHPIPTTLVSVKMVGRIFKAQPSKEIDQYKIMSKEIYNIAIKTLADKKSISYDREAIAGLSVFTLAAMGSSSIKKIIAKIIKNEEKWFIQMCFRDLKELRHKWEGRPNEPRESLRLLNEAIYQLATYIKKETLTEENIEI